MRFGIGLQIFHAPRTDIPLRHIDNPGKRKVVFVNQKPQIRQRVLDFGTPVKRHAAVQHIGNLALEKYAFGRARDVMRTVHDRDVLIRHTAFMQLGHLVGNPFRFFLTVVGIMAYYLVAVGKNGNQLFFGTVDVFGN